MSGLKLQLEQINFIVGDLGGNCQKIISSYQKAKGGDVDLVIFSELALTGYPPEDLLLRKDFLNEIEEKIFDLIKETKNQKTAILLGCPYRYNDQHKNEFLNNSAILIEDGKIICVSSKTCLPSFGVFDEHRYFTPAKTLTNFEFRGKRLAILICEDLWAQKNAFLLGDKVIDAIISINASPFQIKKQEKRRSIAKQFIKDLKKPLIYVNQIGGQDGLVFDGASFALNSDGEVKLQMKEFQEDSQIIILDDDIIANASANQESDLLEKIYNACLLGLRDYLAKNGFTKVVIGMSGGIDSALVATIAVDALGSDNVKLVALPSKFNSNTSMEDAVQCSDNLGVKLDVIEIQNAVEEMLKSLEGEFAETEVGIAEENIQSRVRGNILMTLSNKFGYLLISTGNKSEMAVGYATIYGDMCGAFNPIKDIYKTQVFELSTWRNKNIPSLSIYPKMGLIPENIINKEPTAELRENQKDSDSLPEYEILDGILFSLIEQKNSIDETINAGFESELVKKVAKLLFNSEYKRRQACIGPKISKKAFDRERRYPIINNFFLK